MAHGGGFTGIIFIRLQPAEKTNTRVVLDMSERRKSYAKEKNSCNSMQEHQGYQLSWRLSEIFQGHFRIVESF